MNVNNDHISKSAAAKIITSTGAKAAARLAYAMELPDEIIHDLPLITIIGTRCMKVENHKGIIEFNVDTVKIGAKGSILKIYGKKLSILEICSEYICINGCIMGCEFTDK